jgi:hypothetical protein
MASKVLKINTSELRPNDGQIAGLPTNPRQINDEKYKKLKKSLQDDPEMLDLRELLVYRHGDAYVVVAGNMRYRAAVDLGIKSLPCKIISPETPVSKLKAYTVKDNSSFGEWDYDMLANDWDAAELDDWGVDVWQDDTDNTDAGLPAELQGNDLTPAELSKLAGDDKTVYDRIIVIFLPEEKSQLEELIGKKIDKVVYKFNELKQE